MRDILLKKKGNIFRVACHLKSYKIAMCGVVCVCAHACVYICICLFVFGDRCGRMHDRKRGEGVSKARGNMLKNASRIKQHEEEAPGGQTLNHHSDQSVHSCKQYYSVTFVSKYG